MAFEELINEELKYARYEYQIKFKTNIQESELIKLGAKKLGTVFHEDQFFIPKDLTVKSSDELIRIRKEGDEDLLFTYKGPVANLRMRNRLVVNKQITESDAENIAKNYKKVITINKKRAIFVLDKIRILLDKVDYLGSFVEFDVEKEGDYGLIDPSLEILHLDPDNAIKLSYFELALISANPFKRNLFGLYYKLEKITFGMSSAIMTVLGIIVGLISAQQSLSAVLGGIASIAVADSMADAMGVYTAKRSERGSSAKVAIKNGLYTFWSKLIFSSSFLLWFIIFPLNYAFIISVIWGLTILAFINFLISFVQEENILLNIFKNIGLTCLIIVASYLVGNFVSNL